uniref:Endonuclease/exonuclease/phosphatase domain-containing protein n=1 Tax=Tetranychus urticae TaxID=32264 RepID=T1JVQ9_TETUR
MSKVFILTFNLCSEIEMYSIVKTTISRIAADGLVFVGLQEITRASARSHNSPQQGRHQFKLEFYDGADMAIFYTRGAPKFHQFTTCNNMIQAIIHSEDIGFINTHRSPNMDRATVFDYYTNLLATICRMLNGGKDNDDKEFFSCQIFNYLMFKRLMFKSIIKKLRLVVHPTSDTYFDKEGNGHIYDYILHTENVVFSEAPEDFAGRKTDHIPIFIKCRLDPDQVIAKAPYGLFPNQKLSQYAISIANIHSWLA